MQRFKPLSVFSLSLLALTGCAASNDDIAGDELDLGAADFAQFEAEAEFAAPSVHKSLRVGDLTRTRISRNKSVRYRFVVGTGAEIQIDAVGSSTSKPQIALYGRVSSRGTTPTSPLTNGTALPTGGSASLARRLSYAGVYEIKIANTGAASDIQIAIRCNGGECVRPCGEGDPACPTQSTCSSAGICVANGTPSATTCNSNAANTCGDLGFCRVDTCHAYALEGGSCGGFVRPEYREACPPALSCVANDPRIADLPGRCMLRSTIENIARTAGRLTALENASGELRATTGLGPIGCTRNLCSPSNACCNTCNAEVVLTSGSSTLALASASGGEFAACSGTNCDYDTRCGGYEPGEKFLVIGRYDARLARFAVSSALAVRGE